MHRTKRGNLITCERRRDLRRTMTEAENQVWLRLRRKQFRGLRFRRQHGIGPFIIDFFCAEKRLAVEIDGDIHLKTEQAIKDREREEILREIGVIVVRYWNNDVISNMSAVLEDLDVIISGISTSPNPCLSAGRPPYKGGETGLAP